MGGVSGCCSFACPFSIGEEQNILSIDSSPIKENQSFDPKQQLTGPQQQQGRQGAPIFKQTSQFKQRTPTLPEQPTLQNDRNRCLGRKNNQDNRVSGFRIHDTRLL